MSEDTNAKLNELTALVYQLICTGKPPQENGTLRKSEKNIRDRVKVSNKPGFFQRNSHEQENRHPPSADTTLSAEQEKDNQESERHPNEGIISVAGKARHRGSKVMYLLLLQSTVRDSEEEWRPNPRTKLEKTQLTRRKLEFQSENPEINILHDRYDGLSQIFRPKRCIYAHPGKIEVQ
ncbi:hypothetical protein AYI68_g6727 [Smittium mucronatum]|uniref:Uncharacterized protein n=1 Tax=Smittium mucronatum TaxID=133383 RepID=A0A1R0GQQ1_9FUNG|nr:hypothetical protein AYI68_g7063 [Smittium mucronatum]OLY79210.1 hypothetical protein AYI68_g6727 [Smittium mucronatum]